MTHLNKWVRRDQTLTMVSEAKVFIKLVAGTPVCWLAAPHHVLTPHHIMQCAMCAICRVMGMASNHGRYLPNLAFLAQYSPTAESVCLQMHCALCCGLGVVLLQIEKPKLNMSQLIRRHWQRHAPGNDSPLVTLLGTRALDYLPPKSPNIMATNTRELITAVTLTGSTVVQAHKRNIRPKQVIHTHWSP